MIEGLRGDQEGVDASFRDFSQFPTSEKETDAYIAYLLQNMRQRVSQETYRLVRELISRKGRDKFREVWAQTDAGLREQIEAAERRPISEPIQAFSGMVTTVPSYVPWLMRRYGEMRLLHYRETKEQIGRGEADELLRMRMKKGGQKQFDLVNRTVNSLLGLNLDVFAAEESHGGNKGVTGKQRCQEPFHIEKVPDTNGAVK